MFGNHLLRISVKALSFNLLKVDPPVHTRFQALGILNHELTIGQYITVRKLKRFLTRDLSQAMSDYELKCSVMQSLRDLVSHKQTTFHMVQKQPLILDLHPHV